MTERPTSWRVRKDLANYLSVVVALIATLAGIITAIQTFRTSTSRTPGVSETVVALGQDITSLKDRIELTDQKLAKLEQSMTTFSQSTDSSKAAMELNRIGGSVAEIQTKVSNIEQVVMDNPSKALGIPLLRKDLDNVKESYASTTLAVRQEIERVYDLNKWFVGLMFTMALGILGLAIGNIYKGKEKEPK